MAANAAIRAEPQRGPLLPLGQFSAGEPRIGRETKGDDQCQQGLVGNHVVLTKRVGVASLDAEKPGEPFDRRAVAHLRGTYLYLASSSSGSAGSAGATLVAITAIFGASFRGARLMNSAKQWACSR